MLLISKELLKSLKYVKIITKILVIDRVAICGFQEVE